MPWFYYIARVIVRGLLKLLTRCQINGVENVPTEGPLLIVANHLNLADPPLLGVSLRREVMFMAKKELFRHRLIGYFIRSFGAFAVHRGQLDRGAIRRAHQVLTDGSALVMFPEGTRSSSGQMQRALPGAALLAMHSGAPVLPVGIFGTEKIKGMTWFLRRPRITVNVGRPCNLPLAGHRLNKAELAELADTVMERIAELLPADYRGEYGDGGKR